MTKLPLILLLLSLTGPAPSSAQDKDIDASLKSFEKDLWSLDRSVKQIEDYPRKLDANLKRQDAKRTKEDRMAGRGVELEWNKKLKEHDITINDFEKRAKEIERRAAQQP